MDTIFVNEFICSFENKEKLLNELIKNAISQTQESSEDIIKEIENTVNQIKETGEDIIKKIKKKLSFFKPYSFKSNEAIEEVCLKKEVFFPDFQELFYFNPNNRFKITLEEFKDNILSDISFRLLSLIFNYCIDKFNLKPINDSYKRYFLQKNEETFFYKNCCFDKHFFKKISVVLYGIGIEIEKYYITANPKIDLFFNFEIKLIF